jgi:phospholipid/cholesterol/gamma-HCH transport system permease protein
MKNPADTPARGVDVSYDEKGVTTLHFIGRMDAGTAPSLIKMVKSLLTKNPPADLTIDLAQVTFLDDFGALVLVEIKNLLPAGNGQLKLTHAGQKVKDVLAILNIDALAAPSSYTKKRSPNLFTRLGSAAFRQASDLKFAFSFIGAVCFAFFHVVRHPSALRADDTLNSMEKTGVDALPIVGLISFLLGLIMAFMSSVQLRQFGANIYVASLVSLAMVRELGPIMTAIIVAGRSGSAFAAEIGTMKISEEVDALFTMGFDPVRFLVVPKIVATVITVPFLTLFSDLSAILGGLVVGVFMLDLTANAYISQTIKTLSLFDVFWGLMKSGFFALLITMVGCLRGFQVKGGAAAVGQATTSAVVTGIFMIIFLDSILAVILRYWG